MKNYAKIADVIAPYVGKTLTSQQVIALVIEKFPEMAAKQSSIMPADMAREDLRYADQVFKTVGRGQYLVLPIAERKVRASVGGTRSNVSLADALKAAHALIAANPTPSAPAKTDAPQTTVAPVAGKPDASRTAPASK